MNLAQNCDTIVLDEPTTYLDINRQRKFYEDICRLKTTRQNNTSCYSRPFLRCSHS